MQRVLCPARRTQTPRPLGTASCPGPPGPPARASFDSVSEVTVKNVLLQRSAAVHSMATPCCM